MDRALTIASPAHPGVRLRAAGPEDLDELRAWKNAAKAGFFFKGEINDLMQKAWFAGYLARKDDYMFVVERDGKKAGCLGFRLENGAADVYNVIASPATRRAGLMTSAMIIMCSYIGAHHTRTISCKVLKGNPALGYYERCGLRAEKDCGDHSVLALDWSDFEPIPTTVS